jgi:hypothetical protein
VDSWAHSLEDPTVEQSVIERRGQSGAENIGNSMHDDCVKENAKLHDKAGLDCYLVRDAGGGCCAWCAAIAGRYKYADAPDDIFRRHDHCTCTTTYECGRMRQDVWSKESNWSKEQSQEYMRQHDAALAEKRKELRAKGVNVSNAKLNKEEIEAIKARIDASETSKPTVNTPQQAKELERQMLEKNPVTKLTPEQAKELEQKVLAEKQIMKNTPEQAAELEKQALDKSIQSGILESNGNRINIGMQFFSKSIEDFATIILPKDEYAHVMSEIATNITEEQSTKRVIKKHIGDYIYTVENKGFGNYRVIGKDLIE